MRSSLGVVWVALLSFASVSLAGCATSFVGEAHYPGGARACYASCANQQMQMSGFVYLGEYSSACVCAPRTTVAGTTNDAQASSAAAGSAGGAVGVIMQARAAQQQQQR
jgi:hypothetical protein